jgi:F-type H+-transporting ATPase subunit a
MQEEVLTVHPMHQFELKRLITLNIAGYDLSFTNSSLAMMMVGALVSLMTFLFYNRKNKLVPTKLQAFFEVVLSAMNGIIKDNLAPEGRKYFNLIFSIFIFILSLNIIGLLPFSFTATSHISITFSLAIIIFFITVAIAIARHGLLFFKIFIPHGTPLWLAPLMFILELFSFLMRPVSLGIRLAANMMAGHIMLDVLAFFTILMKWLGIFPFAFLTIMMGFEFFVALLQSYIFTVFACVYISEALHH